MEALERIIEAVNSGKTTELDDDWLEVARNYKLSGSDNAETIKNIERFIADNFFSKQLPKQHMFILEVMEILICGSVLTLYVKMLLKVQDIYRPHRQLSPMEESRR